MDIFSGNQGKPLQCVEVFDYKNMSWSDSCDMPTAHCSAAMTVLNGRLFVIGGLTIGGASKRVEALGFTPAK